MMNLLLVLFALFLSAPASADVFKCSVDGKTTFSDKPCTTGSKAIFVRPASGATQRELPPSSSTALQSDEKSKTQAVNNRIRRKILSDDIEREELRIPYLQNERDERLNELRAKKRRANNNLAGATWEQSISDEMIAVTNSYDSKIRVQQKLIDDMKAKRDAMK